MTNAVNIAQLGSNNGTMRNRIINGAMMIDQRNAGASTSVQTTTTYASCDRWYTGASANSKYTVQQNAGSVTPPAGFTNYIGITSSAATAVGAADYYYLSQRVEGYNVADFGFGTANAQPVTLSFWVRSSLTGTFSVSLFNSAANRFYPATYTISAANTWEQKSITVAGDTSGTWLTNNGIGMSVYFSLGLGSDYASTANTWASNGYVATGTTNLVATNGATFYITGVQLEEGTAASPFENRLITTELSLCQRYCMRWCGNQPYEGIGGGSFNAFSSTGAQGIMSTPVSMRATPTITFSTLGFTDVTAINNAVSNITLGTVNSGNNSLNLTITSTGMTSGRTGYLYANNSTSAFLIASAEL